MFTILYLYLYFFFLYRTCSDIFVAHSLKMTLRLLRDLKTVENNS